MAGPYVEYSEYAVLAMPAALTSIFVKAGKTNLYYKLPKNRCFNLTFNKLKAFQFILIQM